MIEGIFGLPGSGKSYEMTRRLVLYADRGYQCYSVTPMNHPNIETITYDDISDPWLPPGKIGLDEVHLWIGSNDHRNLKPEVYEKLSQTRKDGHDLLYTSQHESKVLKQLRDNTNYGWVCTAWLPIGPHPWIFSARCWEMHKMRRGKPIDRYAHWFNGRVAGMYDTYHAIQAQAAVNAPAARSRQREGISA